MWSYCVVGQGTSLRLCLFSARSESVYRTVYARKGGEGEWQYSRLPVRGRDEGSTSVEGLFRGLD